MPSGVTKRPVRIDACIDARMSGYYAFYCFAAACPEGKHFRASSSVPREKEMLTGFARAHGNEPLVLYLLSMADARKAASSPMPNNRADFSL